MKTVLSIFSFVIFIGNKLFLGIFRYKLQIHLLFKFLIEIFNKLIKKKQKFFLPIFITVHKFSTTKKSNKLF